MNYNKGNILNRGASTITSKEDAIHTQNSDQGKFLGKDSIGGKPKKMSRTFVGC